MSSFRPYKITSAKLSSLPVIDGQLIFCTDTGEVYVDDGTTRTCVSRLTVPINPTDTSKLNIWIETK